VGLDQVDDRVHRRVAEVDRRGELRPARVHSGSHAGEGRIDQFAGRDDARGVDYRPRGVREIVAQADERLGELGRERGQHSVTIGVRVEDQRHGLRSTPAAEGLI
jgi:hypothetical protein